MNYRLKNCPASYKGMTLVEIMIALVIGLVLTGGVLEIFISSKQSYRSLETLSRLQGGGRIAMMIMGERMRMAGYKSNALAADTTVFPAAGAFAAGQVVTGPNDVPGTPDTISVRFEGNTGGTVQDCLGNVVAAGTLATISFSVNTATNEFRCSIDGGVTWQPFITDVTDMQILYGIDTDGTRTANKFIPAISVLLAEWSGVVSVRMTLALNANNYSQSYTNTIALRNRAR